MLEYAWRSPGAEVRGCAAARSRNSETCQRRCGWAKTVRSVCASENSAIPLVWLRSMRTVIRSASGKRAVTRGGRTAVSGSSRREPALLDELQRGDRDERLHDAAGAEPGAGPHARARPEVRLPRGAGPGPVAGDADVERHARERRLGGLDGAVEDRLEPRADRARGLGLRARTGGRRRGEQRRERRGRDACGGRAAQAPRSRRRGSHLRGGHGAKSPGAAPARRRPHVPRALIRRSEIARPGLRPGSRTVSG